MVRWNCSCSLNFGYLQLPCLCIIWLHSQSLQPCDALECFNLLLFQYCVSYVPYEERLAALTFQPRYTVFQSYCLLPGGANFVTLFCCKGIKRCVNEMGMGFMMSANYHPAMKIVRPVRKNLKIKTIFNILGPLLNPARVPHAVIGVYHENIVSIYLSGTFL